LCLKSHPATTSIAQVQITDNIFIIIGNDKINKFQNFFQAFSLVFSFKNIHISSSLTIKVTIQYTKNVAKIATIETTEICINNDCLTTVDNAIIIISIERIKSVKIADLTFCSSDITTSFFSSLCFV
jgi:hypothetical protein